MAQNMFTWGEKQEQFTEEDAKREFGQITEKLRAEAENIPVPDALGTERLLQLLENEVPGETKPPRRISLKKEYLRFAAYAACFVLVISGFARFVSKQAQQDGMTLTTAAAGLGEADSSAAAAADAPAENEHALMYGIRAAGTGNADEADEAAPENGLALAEEAPADQIVPAAAPAPENDVVAQSGDGSGFAGSAQKSQAASSTEAPPAPPALSAGPAANGMEEEEEDEEDEDSESESSSEEESSSEDEPESVVAEPAKSYDAVYSALMKAKSSGRVLYSFERDVYFAMGNADITINSAPSGSASASESKSESESPSYTTTNTQIAGVDEADIVKTDGEYLYHYRQNPQTYRGEIQIVRASDLSVCSTISLPNYATGELYLSDDVLILAAQTTYAVSPVKKPVGELVPAAPEGTEESVSGTELLVPRYYRAGYRWQPQTTTLFVYDVSDRFAPELKTTFEQAGRYISSRLADGVLYLVSDSSVNLYHIFKDTPASEAFPFVSRDGVGRLLLPEDIFLPVLPQCDAGYCLVTGFDLDTGDAVTKAVLGDTDTVMMTKDTLILANTLWNKDWTRRNTGITRFAVGGKRVLRYVSSGKVPGWTDGQFAFDVADGNLRVATTSYQKGGADTQNNLYIFDAQMRRLGGVEGLAKGETIYSVRYLGDTAYVVTFRQVDPLFVIDLSNPAKPAVAGQLKIPGFSEYLHPVGDGLLIGLGQSTTENQSGGVVTDGLKLSLFDVSDPKTPRERASLTLGGSGSWSEALYNHKAFLYDDENDRFGFAASLNGNAESFSGYLVFSYDESGFARLGAIENPTGTGSYPSYAATIERGVVIGDTLYTVADGGVGAYSYETFELTGEAAYDESDG